MPSEVNLYKEAGILYCKVASGVCNLKNGLFQSHFTSDLKKLLAIVAEAIKNKTIITEILHRSKLGQIETSRKQQTSDTRECNSGGIGCENCRIKVQIYDMLFGQAKSNLSGCPLVSKMRIFKDILDELISENKLQSIEEVLNHYRPTDKSIELPVYVRINLLLITRHAAIEHFVNEGYNLLDYEDKSVKYNQFLEWLKELNEGDFMPDYHLHEDLLVFHSSAVLHTDKLVRARKVLIQDKASCIPAAVLDPDTDMDVIDACAAPGNKTTHLLSILSQKKKPSKPISLFAFDRDETRFKMLEHALSIYREPHAITQSVTVSAQLEDFTKVDPTDPRYANVGYICLDPSCSGSGIMRQVDRMAERNNNSRVDEQRLQSLRNFQAMLLSHALSFPNVKRVVYSTCSVTLEENEAVVEEIVEKFGDEFQLRPIWMDSWMTRGKKLFKECIRTNPSYDLCNGFFVACFDRIRDHLPSDARPKPKLHTGSFVKHRKVKEQPETAEEQDYKKTYRKRRKTRKTGRKAKGQQIKRQNESTKESIKQEIQILNTDKKKSIKKESLSEVAIEKGKQSFKADKKKSAKKDAVSDIPVEQVVKVEKKKRKNENNNGDSNKNKKSKFE